MNARLAFALVAIAAELAAGTVIDSGSSTDSGFTGGTALTIDRPLPGLQDITTRYGDFRYNIPCAEGPYLITFRFVETAVNARGQRVFSIRINQQVIFDALDLYAAAGRNPFSRSIVALCSDGNFNIQFSTIVRSASVASIELEPLELKQTTISYIVPQDPKRVAVTDAVPVWFDTDPAGYYVPRPIIEPDSTIDLLYLNIAVYRNGIRQRSENQAAGPADYSAMSIINQLRILPAGGARWPDTDTITVDYTAVWPPAPVPDPTPGAIPQGAELIRDNCTRCHGNDLEPGNVAGVGGLDLRTRAAMMRGGSRGPALVPGDPTASLIYRFISRPQWPTATEEQTIALTTSKEQTLGMPPFFRLTPDKIRIIRDWIAAGAPAIETTRAPFPAKIVF